MRLNPVISIAISKKIPEKMEKLGYFYFLVKEGGIIIDRHIHYYTRTKVLCTALTCTLLLFKIHDMLVAQSPLSGSIHLA